MMVALESLRHLIQRLMLDVADLETDIYGSSNDMFEKAAKMLEGQDESISDSRHTMAGLFDRVLVMGD